MDVPPRGKGFCFQGEDEMEPLTVSNTNHQIYMKVYDEDLKFFPQPNENKTKVQARKRFLFPVLACERICIKMSSNEIRL